VEFLTARYDEAEATALAAPGMVWTACTKDSIAGASVYDEQWLLLSPVRYDHDNALSNKAGATGPMYIERAVDDLCAHIARHDPASVLADLAAKRAILARMVRYCWEPKDKPCGVCERIGCATLRDAAQPYADHPDYDQAWTLES
jgi:hypothetical protein